MMRARWALVAAAAIVLAAPGPACAEGGGWADLARRIAGADPLARLGVTVGAEPPGFEFPLPVRPALRIVGSTWFASNKNAPPEIVRIYYAPASQTRAAWAALYAQLVAAGYRHPDSSEYAGSFDVTYGPAEHLCPADLNRPAIDFTMNTVDGLPAMDVKIRLHASSTACRSAALGPRLSTHAPELFDIPGMTFRDRVAELGGAPPSAYSAGTVRTALPPREAVAKIAERFAAKGWVERSAAVSDDTTTQRFELVEGAYRWDALLVFDRRSDGVYGVLIAISDSRSQRPVR